MTSILCLSRAPLDYKGGIPSYCKYFYSFLEKHYVEFINIDLNSNLTKTRIIKFKDKNQITFPSFFRFLTFAVSFRYLFHILLKSRDFEYIHLQHPDPFSSFCILLLILTNKKNKLIVTWHADVYKKYLFLAPLIVLLDFTIFIFCEKIIFHTPAHVKSSLFGRFNFMTNKSIIIPHLLENEQDIPTKFYPKIYPKNNEVFKLISIGRLVNYKGYKYALKALSELDFNFEYLIIGNGPLYKSLNKYISRLKLTNKVKIICGLSDQEKYQYLKESHLFMFPSCNKAEAYGVVQIEAMAFSLPIINTNLKNGVNYLMPSSNCLTVPTKSCSALKEALLKIKNDKIIFNKLNKKSYERYVFLSEINVKERINSIFNGEL